MSECRALTNLVGNATAAVVVARWRANSTAGSWNGRWTARIAVARRSAAAARPEPGGAGAGAAGLTSQECGCRPRAAMPRSRIPAGPSRRYSCPTGWRRRRRPVPDAIGAGLAIGLAAVAIARDVFASSAHADLRDRDGFPQAIAGHSATAVRTSCVAPDRARRMRSASARSAACRARRPPGSPWCRPTAGAAAPGPGPASSRVRAGPFPGGADHIVGGAFARVLGFVLAGRAGTCSTSCATPIWVSSSRRRG